jgi:hypothetical protein
MPGKIVFKYDLDKEKLSAEGQGFKGPTCLKTTEKLLAGVSAKIENRKLKPEYACATEKTTVTL